jgi:hypothetical protein
VVAASQVGHERVPGGDDAGELDRFESAHRAQPGLEPAVIGFDAVVGVLLHDVPRTRREFVDHARVDRRPVGLDARREGRVNRLPPLARASIGDMVAAERAIGHPWR